MFLIITVITVTTISFLIWTWMRNKFSYWKKRGILTPPYSFLFGNIKTLATRQESFSDNHLSLYKLLKSNKLNHGGFYLMWTPIYVPIDVNIVKSIMQVDFEYFVDRGMYSNEKADPLSAHLFSLGGKKWKLLRNKLSPTFTSGKLKMMHETIVNCTSGLYRVMDRELVKPVDIKDILGRFTTDIIGSCAFGIDCDSLNNPDTEFREKGKALFHAGIVENIKQMMCYTMPEFMTSLNTKIISEDVAHFFMNVVKDTVAYREKLDIIRKDFMHLLIQLKNKGKLVDDEKLDVENISENENRITIEEIAAQVFIFFEAGFETSSTTMTFCLYELAKNKTIQNRLRKEIKEVLSKHDGELTYDVAMEMQYLEQVINETLRKYPPLPCLHRKSNKAYKVPGEDLILEKGMRVMIPVIGIHHDPDYYPDPQKFDPDRFSDENKKNRQPFTFIPFGGGPRICIGARFGILQTKVGLTALLVNYEFTVSEKTVEPIIYDPPSFILSTKGGIWLDVEKISPYTIPLLHQKN